MASIKGVSYLDYTQSEKERLEKELEELPDTDNFLSVLLEYYSFKSVNRSGEVLVAITGVSLTIYICSNHFDFSFLSTIAGVWATQLLMFIIGFYLKYKYEK